MINQKFHGSVEDTKTEDYDSQDISILYTSRSEVDSEEEKEWIFEYEDFLRKLKRKRRLMERPPKFAKRRRADGIEESEEELVLEAPTNENESKEEKAVEG
jgi:hypothetical protein